MSRQEKFSIRKTTLGVVSACIAVVGLFALMGANQEVKADEVNVTVADTAVVENDEANEELAVLAASPEESPVEIAEQELATAQEELATASQALAQAQAQEAAAEETLTQAQAAVDAVETSRTETRQVGTTTETVQTGVNTETVQTGTKTEQVQVGTESKLVEGTRTEQVQTGTKTTTKFVGMETVQEQTGTQVQRVKVGEEEVQVQVGSTFETRVVGTETKSEIVGYKTEQVKVGERTVTEGGEAGLKDGTITYNFDSGAKLEGLLVSDEYLDALKKLANGNISSSDVSSIARGDAEFEAKIGNRTSYTMSSLIDFVGGAVNAAYGSFYRQHQYDIANSDTTTKYDVLDLPYEVRKDLALFYVALVNDLRSKVGTESLKVTEESLQQAYDIVNDVRVISFESVSGDKDYLKGVSRSQLEEKGFFTNSIREKTVISDTGRGILQEGVNLSNKYNADLYSLVYSGEGNASRDFENPRYQTVDQLKYGIISVLGQQLYGFEGKGYNGQEAGGVNGTYVDNFKTVLAVLGLDGNTNNTVGLDVSLYNSDSRGNQDKYSQVMITFSDSSATAITNPYETSTGGTTRVEDVYETRETPIYETKTVDVTERVEVPVYRTQVRDIYEDREVPTYTNVTRPKYETVEEPVYEEREVAYSEVVVTPIYETREVPVYTEVETPIYETREAHVYETVNITVAIPQDLLDALTAAQEAYDKAVADSQTAQGNYQEAADKVTAAQAKLAALQPAPQPVEDTPTTGDQEPSPAETEPVSEEEQVPTETPAVEEVPSPTETPIVEEVPSPTETPVTEDSPAPVEKPAHPTEEAAPFEVPLLWN